MSFTTAFRLIAQPAPDVGHPLFDPKAKVPAEPRARVKVTRAKFWLANGERPDVGKVYELPRSDALDLVARKLAEIVE